MRRTLSPLTLLALLALAGCEPTTDPAAPPSQDAELSSLPGASVETDPAHAIQEATTALAKAQALAGATPSADLAAALARAQQLLAQAQEAFKKGDLAGALKAANESAAISRKLIETLSKPTTTDDPTKKAAGAVEEASSLLAKAKALAGATPSAEVAARLATAQQLLTQAQEALKKGDLAGALKAANDSAAITRALIASFGTKTPNDSISKAAGAIDEALSLYAKAKSLAGASPSAEVAAKLTSASQLLAQAQEALKKGDATGALKAATESASTSRAVIAALGTTTTDDPTRRAAGAIEEATSLYAKAKSLAGATPSAEVAAQLGSASQLLGQAQEALKKGDTTGALNAATQSAAISRKLIETLGTTTPTDDPARKAAAAIDEATSLLVKAKSVAGSNPTAEVLSKLTSASQLVTQAQELFKKGDYAGALKAATDSAAISRALLAALGTTTTTSTAAATAQHAIDEATTAYSRAKSALGNTPGPDALALLSKASALLQQSQEAYKAGDYSGALTLANQSAELSRKLIPTTD